MSLDRDGKRKPTVRQVPNILRSFEYMFPFCFRVLAGGLSIFLNGVVVLDDLLKLGGLDVMDSVKIVEGRPGNPRIMGLHMRFC